MQSIYTAASGMSSQQKRLDAIANNIANINTTGYRGTRVDFKDTLYTTLQNPEEPESEENLKQGTGVAVASTSRDFSAGSYQTTGSSLDFALEGDGFFVLQGEQGDTYYTRNGSFSVSPEDGQNYLVSAQGYYVLDTDGNRITLPENTSELSLDSSGALVADGQSCGVLAVADFANPSGLLSDGSNCYSASENSGEPEQAEGYTLVQGSLESSNVELADELTLMLRSQRAYSLASRALQTADSMEGLANSVLG